MNINIFSPEIIIIGHFRIYSLRTGSPHVATAKQLNGLILLMKSIHENTSAQVKQAELFEAETTWFHVFKAMIDNGDVARMGPYAVTVYLVIKSFTNFNTGLSFPSVETISAKSGISAVQVKRCLKILEETGYISKERAGKNNVYRLREKVEFTDDSGRPAAVATWDYLPSTIDAARAEIKNFRLTGESEGLQVVHIEKLILNVQINNGSSGVSQINLGEIRDKGLREQLASLLSKANVKAL